MESPNPTTRNSLAIRVFRIDVTRVDEPVVDDPATSPTLEQQYIPTTDGVVPSDPANVTPGRKSLCIDANAALTANGLVNTKLEGISLVAHITNPAANPNPNPTTIDFVPLPSTCS